MPARLARRPRVRGFAIAAFVSSVLSGCVASRSVPAPVVPFDEGWSVEAQREPVVMGRSGDVDDSLIVPIDERQIVPDQVRALR